MTEQQKTDLMESARQLRHLADCKEAFAEGKRVQHRVYDGDAWKDLSNPGWDDPPKCYRIVPAPVLRTKRNDELPPVPFGVRFPRSVHKWETTCLEKPRGGVIIVCNQSAEKGMARKDIEVLRRDEAEYHDPRTGQWLRFETEEGA